MPDNVEMSLATEEAAILAITGDDDVEHHRVGVHYNNIVDNDLAPKAGYRTSRDYFASLVKKRKGLSQSTLSLYGAIARTFTEDQTAAFGVSILGKFLTYMKLAKYSPDFFSQSVVRVPRADGSFEEKPLRQCTDADMRAALRALRAPAHPLSEEDSAELDTYQAAVDEVLGADHPSTIKAHSGNEETTVDFDGFPLKRLPAVFAALDAAGPEVKPEDAQVVQMLADALEEARRDGDDMAIRAKSRGGEVLVTISDVPLSRLVEALDALRKRAAVVVR